ncbi:MAG: hypothetical protein ACUVUG_08635 [Candidatus Aminicenantia bacterium]
MNLIAILLIVNLCGTCHPDINLLYEKSVHRSENIQCFSCHGGNPSSLDEKIAHSANFRKILRAQIPEHCGSCHSNPILMKPYGIPSDQLELYLLSFHGKDFQKISKKPVCTDCHGVHETKKKEEPDSLINSLNVKKICEKCHKEEAEEYSSSYHFTAWKERKNSPVCTTCHDSHLPIKFRAKDIDKLCGRCHGISRDSFLEGPHGKAFREKDSPSCTDCHSHHAILKSDILNFSKTCDRCHQNDSKEFKLGEKISVMLIQTKQEIDKAEETLKNAEKIPLRVEDYRVRLEEANTCLTEALTITHSLSLEKTEETLGKARFISKEIEGEIHEKVRNLRWRRFGLFVFWFYLFLTIFIILRYKRWLIKRRIEE